MSRTPDPPVAPAAFAGPAAGPLVMLAVDRAAERLASLPLAIGIGGLTQGQIDRVDLAPLARGLRRLGWAFRVPGRSGIDRGREPRV